MPRRPRRPCTAPGCPELTPRGGRCPKHQKEADRAREAGGRTYDTRWQRVRRAYLYANPWCVLCSALANVADHHPVSRRELIARGEPNPDAWKHMRPVCASCHNAETAQRQPGGFAAERRSEREANDRPPF
ncbi:HNH endonuclease [Streptomyces qinzhouensis]|uniref:HNH endonuclease n=1 Tax=Streptomyces qinzhouensis TaxID=2599401 RepID=A0A5B8JPZ8_9ACTN|nr:HNH endonuclease [Streptomyces qinzhouensis]QDY79783.1 HNH endonuclease [Streptomyces qinzhouensis]